MEEEMDPESWLAREVYANFGLAMYAAQVLEHEIVNLIAWTDVSNKGYAERGEIDTLYESLFRETFGSLRNRLVEKRQDINHLEDKLKRALALRNFLAHHYFRERASAAMYEEGKRHMISELRKARDLFGELDAELTTFTHGALERLGLLAKLHEIIEAGPPDDEFGRPLPGI
jgi:hypothetical protein